MFVSIVETDTYHTSQQETPEIHTYHFSNPLTKLMTAQGFGVVCVKALPSQINIGNQYILFAM